MRVVVTGSRGFVGRHLVRALHERGDVAVGIDLATGKDALDFFRRDPHQYDLAIHCAAIVGGRRNIDRSPLAVATNLGLDAWFYRWAVRTKTRRLVYYSSSAAYPIHVQTEERGWPLEEDMINPALPEVPDQTYGWAKLTGERLAGYATAEGCDVLIPRAFSGYGEDQSLDYPFPALAQRAARREDPYTIWGDGTSVRDWIHISDIVAATLELLDQGVTGPVNLGTGRATTFSSLAAMMCAEAGYQPAYEHVLDAPQGVHTRVCDPRRMLGYYQPRVSVEEGVHRSLASRR